MIYPYHDRPDDLQTRARQVGEALPMRAQQPQENTLPGGPEIEELVERARWMMRRDPMRERGRAGY